MRCDQPMGLPTEASVFLEENCKMVPELSCPKCGHDITMKSKYSCRKYGIYEGMFENEYPLVEYDLKDGSIVREALEACPWSSGPMMFLKLVDKDGKDLFVWGEESINSQL